MLHSSREPGCTLAMLLQHDDSTINIVLVLLLLLFTLLVLQFPEHSFYNLRSKILLFRHDAFDQNVLRLVTSAKDIVDGTLVEVVLSGMIISVHILVSC